MEFPEFHLFPRTEQFITRVKRFARFLTHRETELCLSEHIDNHLKPTTYEEYQPQLPLTEKGWLAFDSEGNYLDRDF